MVMENLLRKYMEERFAEPALPLHPGTLPFVTISREFGCPSKFIAQLLAERLNEFSSPLKKGPPWRFINKEIIMEAAHELDLNPSKIQYLFHAEKKGALGDIFASFSDSYKSDRIIKKTIQEVVKSFYRKGNTILVGRGGVAITHDFSNTLHIRLQAPLEWRIRGLCERHGFSEDEAYRLAADTDKRRIALIEIFLGKKFSQELFDLNFNCQTFDCENIVTGIITMMESKNMI
jgi:cytidylate kinase